MIMVLEVGIEEDLSRFSRFLWQQGIQHRITEQAGNQVLWVVDEATGARAVALYEEMRSGGLQLEVVGSRVPGVPAGAPARTALRLLARSPVTCALVVACLVLFPLTLGYEENRFSPLFHWFTFTDFRVRGSFALFSTLGEGLAALELWRLWTPIFIHFGVLHLVFNLVFVWVCGHRIELLHGSAALLVVTLLAGALSNLAQYGLGGPGLFGGMSGVIYAYLGYCYLWSRLRPERSFALPSGIYIFMLIWLLLGFSGLFDLFLSGSLANGAHLGGLVVGLAMGYFADVLAARRGE